MPKLIKGIKKKIKGKKAKDSDELFTPEEYEKYKKQKEEEAGKAQAELEQATAEEVVEEVPQEEEEEVYPEQSYQHPAAVEAYSTSEDQEVTETASEEKGDWRNYFSATDTVLKKTTTNLEHIKESSYFQVIKKPEEELVVDLSTSPVPAASDPSINSNKRWVDLDKGGFDDSDEDDELKETKLEEVTEEEPAQPKVAVVLKPLDLEDLPEVAAEDYADVFDTTFVDEVEAGQVQLFEIPDFEPDDLGEDPFDTSDVDKILHKDEPKEEIKVTAPSKPQKKKKKNLVNLGCAVDVLTGKLGESPRKREKEPEKEVDLLADFNDKEVCEKADLAEEECKEDAKVNTAEEKCEVDILFSGLESDSDLPTTLELAPVQSTDAENENCERKSSLINVCLSDDLAELLDPLADKSISETEEKVSNLSVLVSELGGESENTNEKGDKSFTNLRDIPKPLGFDVIGDNIKDEIDAEFAAIAAESLAKEKEKAIDEIGTVEGDDPFDTSCVDQVLGAPEEEKDPFDVEFASSVIGEDKKKAPQRPEPPRPSPPSAKVVEDPFDTSAVDSVIPVDPYESLEETSNLPETLQPVTKTSDLETDDFDPFDTSVADCFGKTELKVLEGEFLTDIKNKTDDIDDFDFDPRAEEEKVVEKAPSPICLLTNSAEEAIKVSVLTPQAIKETEDTVKEEEEEDPFDTSIADKVQIKSLEFDFLKTQNKKPPPRPVSPNCLLNSLNTTDTLTELPEDFDPFDTSIANKYEIEAKNSIESNYTENTEEKENHLKLALKPERPPSPFCLLATTPVDENPTLQPISKPINHNLEEEEEFDPFDTSIAEQFGKTELRALESELLRAASPKKIVIDDEFDPRAEEQETLKKPSLPPPRPASPACLLTSNSPVSEQPLPPLSPITATAFISNHEIDPFDTSIANQFGKAEIKNLESELLGEIKVTEDIALRLPPVPQCLFETTPTDSNPTLFPSAVIEPEKVSILKTPEEEEDIDPFDTSIADQFGKTELKALEETLLAPEEKTVLKTSKLDSLLKSVQQESERELKVESADKFFDLTPSAEHLPVLQPQQESFILRSVSPEIDPFDTSIANKIGTSELKALESQLLVDSGTKRGLSDDEFDPREEEKKAPKRPSPPKSYIHNVLESDKNLPDQTLPILQASAVISVTKLDNDLDIDPFDTSIADSIGPSQQELKRLDKEFVSGN